MNLRVFTFLATTISISASPATVREIDSPTGPGAAESSLSVDHRGRLLLSWLEPAGDTGRFALRFARYDKRWSKPGMIVEASNFFVNWADFPSINGDRKGNLIAHWLQKSGSSTYAYDVRYAVSEDGGRTWSRAMLLNRDGKKVEHGFASFAGRESGGFAAVWLDGRQMPENSEEGEMSLRYADIDPNGKIVRDMLLDKRACECCTTAMTQTSDGAVVAYRDRSEKEVRDISIVRVSRGKASAPMPMKLTSGCSVAEAMRKRPLPEPISRITGLRFPKRSWKSREAKPPSLGLMTIFLTVLTDIR